VLTIDSSYDGFDQLTKVRTPKSGSPNYWASLWTYDTHGNVTTLVENQVENEAGGVVAGGRGRGFTYTYTNADEPLLQFDDFSDPGDDQRFSFSFDELGRLTNRTLAKSDGAGGWATEQSASRTYYENGLLKTLQTLDGATSANTVASHQLSYVADGKYLNGNIVSDLFRLRGPDSAAPCRTSDCTASWGYDGRDRLISEDSGSGQTSSFTLDVRGNIKTEQRNGGPYRTAEYTGDRLTADTTAGVSARYLYDPLGNVDCVVAASWAASSCPSAATGQPVANELLSDNIYDYRGRLLAVRGYNAGVLGDRSEYRYDPLGRPITKVATDDGMSTTTQSTYLGTDSAVARETETGTETKTRRYSYDAVGQRATVAENGETYSYVIDQRISVEALLDQNNGVRAAYGYTAYGEANPALTRVTSGFNPSTNLYRYTGKRFDPATGVYDMGARHYFPTKARWFQPDIYVGAAADLGLSLDPLNSNRYLFTGANPVGFIEFDGHGFGPAYQIADGSSEVYNPDRHAALLADAYIRLDCRSGGAPTLVCGAIVEGIREQLAVWNDRGLLCEQTHRAPECGNGRGDLRGAALAFGAVAVALAAAPELVAAGITRVVASGILVAIRKGSVEQVQKIVISVLSKVAVDEKLFAAARECIDGAFVEQDVPRAVFKCIELAVRLAGKVRIPSPRRSGP
jgi:RHS repeat-associated protein